MKQGRSPAQLLRKPLSVGRRKLELGLRDWARPDPLSDFDGFGREDVVDLLESLNHFRANRVIHQEKRKGASSFLIAAKLHTRDVHTGLPEDGSNIADDAGLVVVAEVDHVAAWNHFQ